MAGGVSLQGLSWGDQNNITRWIAMGGGGGGGDDIIRLLTA